jgi:hypothetical protein
MEQFRWSGLALAAIVAPILYTLRAYLWARATLRGR